MKRRRVFMRRILPTLIMVFSVLVLVLSAVGMSGAEGRPMAFVEGR
jgi:hypothetical protein